MTQQKLSILIIDDDPVYRNLSRSILKERFNVFVADRPSIGFKTLKTETINFVITDYQLPEMNGLQIIEQIRQEYPSIETIMISNSGDMDTVIEALRNGAVDYFKKPFTPSDLWMSIERSMKYAELNKSFRAEKKKNETLKKQVKQALQTDIIGDSKAMQEINYQMKMVAETPDTSVLIIGESGTGKELIAKGIHKLSHRSEEMFGAVNMSAIPENLFESEFFGHKKGSFTGAITDKAGWFESTNKGTLFLDEIGEMSISLQVKMLRVLEERAYTKVGSSNSQKFNVRIVSATNKPVEILSAGQEFRLDLFHRLGTFIIQLPPLRERTNDLPELVQFFLQQLSRKMGKTINTIHREALDILMNYQFPGNIRELKNIMERAVIICRGEELLPEHFSIIKTFHSFANEPSGEIYDLKEVEKRTIIKALHKTNYNKTEASRLLNVEWNALHRRIQKYGIQLD